MDLDPERVRRAFTPVAPPRLVPNMFGRAEIDTLFGVLRDRGPWSLIAAQTFGSAEEFLAVAGGRESDGRSRQLAELITPTFRGYFARQAVALHEEVQELFYSTRLLDLVKQMFGARYAFPAQFFFNLRAPARSLDAGHFDPQAFRGLDMAGVPVWLNAVMAKSGLFDRWEVKTGQVITYFYPSADDGGFTYWPEGPGGPPGRFAAPFWNDAVVSHNPRMYHRGEASGPPARRDNPAGLRLETVIAADGPDSWVLRNGEDEVARYQHDEMRFLFHYGARVFDDLDEVAAYYDHTDDLTVELALDMLMDDLRQRGVPFDAPSDPLTDRDFVRLLTAAYAVAPTSYPDEAPVDRLPA